MLYLLYIIDIQKKKSMYYRFTIPKCLEESETPPGWKTLQLEGSTVYGFFFDLFFGGKLFLTDFFSIE